MKANVGKLDKTIRIIVSFILILLLITNFVSETVTFSGWLLAISLIVTGAISYCPVYGLLGINTKKNLNDKADTYYKNQRQFKWYNFNDITNSK